MEGAFGAGRRGQAVLPAGAGADAQGFWVGARCFLTSVSFFPLPTHPSPPACSEYCAEEVVEACGDQQGDPFLPVPSIGSKDRSPPEGEWAPAAHLAVISLSGQTPFWALMVTVTQSS